MKIKEGFVLKNIDDKILVIPEGKTAASFKGMIVLNETGKFLWDNLQKETKTEELVSAVVERYDVDKETAFKDVLNYVEKLKSAGVIE